MKNIRLFIAFMVTIGFSGCSQSSSTSQETSGEWKLLFDGKSTAGWRGYKSEKPGSAWKAVDGTLMLDDSEKEGNSIKDGGNLLTIDQYENFELSLEWKISPCGNSGIMFNAVADSTFEEPWHTAPEMQVLDNSCHPDAKIIKHRAGDLYDMISCSEETVKPAGEWNQVRIISNQGKGQFWLNGVNVVSFDMRSAAWDDLIANSKFKNLPSFGKAQKGHIVLQDHDNKVWFRNIKIKEL